MMGHLAIIPTRRDAGSTKGTPMEKSCSRSKNKPHIIWGLFVLDGLFFNTFVLMLLKVNPISFLTL
jgi:hypothetical protein